MKPKPMSVSARRNRRRSNRTKNKDSARAIQLMKIELAEALHEIKVLSRYVQKLELNQ